MSLRQKYEKILYAIGPAGVLLLGSALPSAASQDPAAAQPAASAPASVAERLTAIREAVSAVAGSSEEAAKTDKNMRLAWGNWWRNYYYRPWGNWGYYAPWNNWHNWNNWGNWWRNW